MASLFYYVTVFVPAKSVKKEDNRRSRNSHPEVFLEKDVLKICSKLTGEDPCRSVISKSCYSNFIEITLWCGCSPVIFMHIFKTPFLKNTSGGMLLQDIE